MADFQENINLIALMNIEEAEILDNQPNRSFHVRDDPFESLSDINFIREYRLSKEAVQELINILEPLMNEGSRSSALDIKTKVSTQ